MDDGPRIVFIAKLADNTCRRLVCTKAISFICRYLCYIGLSVRFAYMTVEKICEERLDTKAVLRFLAQPKGTESVQINYLLLRLI